MTAVALEETNFFIAEAEEYFFPDADVTEIAKATGFAWSCHAISKDGQRCDIPVNADRDHYVWHMTKVHGRKMIKAPQMAEAEKKKGKKKMATVKSSDSTVTAMPKARTTAARRAPKASEPDSVEVLFTYEQDTKNKVRFAEEGLEGVIGTLYVSKRIMAKMGNPESLRVTIASAD